MLPPILVGVLCIVSVYRLCRWAVRQDRRELTAARLTKLWNMS